MNRYERHYLVDDAEDWFPNAVDGDRAPLPVLTCPLSVDLRAEDDVGVFPGVSLGMRLGVLESATGVTNLCKYNNKSTFVRFARESAGTELATETRK